jgi:hypothetical protein
MTTFNQDVQGQPASAQDHRSRKALSVAAHSWYFATAFGQLAFVLFIALFYYPSSLSGQFAAWDSKPNIQGYTPGDTAGNLMFALHVLLAAVLTAGGLLQLLPAVRTRWPALHRWNGRVFMVTALSLALGGLWLVWVRGTYLTLVGGIGISLNAALILVFAVMAWRAAANKRFVSHRRWALRLFIAASAVWFMRLGYVVWGMGTGGIGIGDAMDGPFDIFLAFGNSLVPLAILEIYLLAKDSANSKAHYLMAASLMVCSLLTFGGSVGAWLGMWGPYV